MSRNSGRRGGREARVALRAAPLAEDIKPIKPGLTSGRLRFFSDQQRHDIMETVYRILEDVGFGDALPSTCDYITKVGGVISAQNRICFPRSLVKDTIAKATKNITLYAQNPAYDIHASESRLYFGTAGAAVHLVDPFTKTYQESHLKHIYQAGKIVENCEHIHFFQRPMVARDLPEPALLDFNTCYAAVKSTSKHVGTSWVEPEHVEHSMKMLYEIAGSKEAWQARPFVSQSNCFVVPPLKFAQDACRCLEAAVHHDMPVLLLSAGQAGATSPAAIAGSVVQAVAETLAGLVYVNAIKEGHPAIIGTWPFVSDLRTGAMSGGSAEQSLLMSGVSEVIAALGLTVGVASGMADSKLPDYQAGAEKAYNHSIVGHSHANLIYESAGMHASLLGFCLESLILDNDLLGSVLRTIKGIDVTQEKLSYDTIKKTCLEGPGHYLGSDQTLNLMQSEYLYPITFNRQSPKEWDAFDKPEILDVAHAKMKEYLQMPDHAFISDALDQKLRKSYPICLK